MAKLTRRGAANVTTDLDKLANLFQARFATLGVPEKVAEDFAYRCDLLSDHIEKYAARLAGDGKEDEGDDEGEDTPADKKAADETGTSVEPAPDNQGFDANEIGDVKSGPLETITPPNEPWMGGHFTQENFAALSDKQQAGELAANAAAGRADPKLASSLAKLSKNANFGMAESSVSRLGEAESNLAAAEAEVDACVDAASKRTGSAEFKKTLATLKGVVAAMAKQRASIMAVRGAILKHMKSPVVAMGLGMGGVDMGQEVIDSSVDSIVDAVSEELSHMSRVSTLLRFELNNTPAKTASVLDTIVKAQGWLTTNIGSIVNLFDVGGSIVEGAAQGLTKSLAKLTETLEKTAASRRKAEDKKKVDGKEDKKSDKKPPFPPKEAATTDGYDLFAV